MHTNIQASPRQCLAVTQRNHSSILSAIAYEVSIGLTYATVAHLAHDRGEAERAHRASSRAAEAEREVRRLVSLLDNPAQEAILGQLESFHLAVGDCQDSNFRFAPILRQPSLS